MQSPSLPRLPSRPALVMMIRGGQRLSEPGSRGNILHILPYLHPYFIKVLYNKGYHLLNENKI